MTLPEGFIWVITDEGQGLSDKIAMELKAENQKVVLLSLPESCSNNNSESEIKKYFLSSSNEDDLQNVIENICKNEGQIGGFIHINPEFYEIKSIQDAFISKEYDINKTVFLLAKYLQKSLKEAVKDGQAYFVTVTRMDGQLGFGSSTFPIIGGGLSGLVKSLQKEWKGVFCRSIDLSPKMDNDFASSMIMEELRDPQILLAEVGRDKEAKRITLDFTEKQALESKAKKPDEDTVFLVTGGGRGITADCVIDIAKAYKSKFILLGRTDINKPEPDWALDCEDSAKLKESAISYLKENNEKPTPAKVDKMLKLVQSAKEIKNTLNIIKSVGGRAVYLNADIMSKDDLQDRINQAKEQFGEITGVIHGAGNLADKWIENKTADDFELVFGTKIIGLENLIKAFDLNKLQFFVLFSSVAGYFGNQGQTDYAMANEVLNKFALCLSNLNVESLIVSVNWGPWDSGMVSPTLKKFYTEHNIKTIPIDVGARYLTKELSNYNWRVPQIIVGTAFGRIPEAVKVLPQPVEFQRKILPDMNPFLWDHVIDGNRVLPAACSIGWMVKACEDYLPDYRFLKIKDFKVLKGVVFDGNAPSDFIISLNPISSSEQFDIIDFEVKVKSSNPSGKMQYYHYSGVVTMSLKASAEEVYSNMNLEKNNPVTAKYYHEGEARGILFHGAGFQGIRDIVNCSKERVTSICRVDKLDSEKQGQFRVNSFNPYMTDASLHNIYVYLYQFVGEAVLPSHFEVLEQFDEVLLGENYYVSTELKHVNNHEINSDIIVHNDKGHIYMKFTNAHFTVTPRLKSIIWNK